jgi:hypothetical protein
MTTTTGRYYYVEVCVFLAPCGEAQAQKIAKEVALLDPSSAPSETDVEGELWAIARHAMESGCGFAERSKEMGYEMRSAYLDTMARDLAEEFMKRRVIRAARSPDREAGSGTETNHTQE